MNFINLIKGKKILLVGLGRLGGGVATAKFLVENGAKLTVTDLNTAEELKGSLAKLKRYFPPCHPELVSGSNKLNAFRSRNEFGMTEGLLSRHCSNKIKFVLGEHREEDFLNNDIIIFNQAVSVYNKWVQFARKNKKQIETDLSLMLKILSKERPQMEYIAVTGTRGKTTVTTWAHHFLKPTFAELR